MEMEGEPMKSWAVWRLDGPKGRQIERIAEADTRGPAKKRAFAGKACQSKIGRGALPK
jgi:hypothetical protein